ncbi:hypothetical protein YB2330_006030 [Saitoella coloradoensis]
MPSKDVVAMHPFDPLSVSEIPFVADLLRQHTPLDLCFNTITLHEPPKTELLAYFQSNGPKPDRKALVIALEKGTPQVHEAIVNITTSTVEKFVYRPGMCPTISLEDLEMVESIVRSDPGVIEQCKILGVEDMSKVYCDAWTIGFDKRWGAKRRMQQALMYYRESPTDNQYAHPLDFCPIVDTDAQKVIEIDIRSVNGERTPIPKKQYNYLPEFVAETYRPDLKPINITQPEGVSFQMNGNEIEWTGFKFHIGFNAREGIVLNNIRYADPQEGGKDRSMFYRLSIAEMVVPYGEPSAPHHRKHAFDVGEYGMGAMTNSLKLGCDCKGSIHYLDGVYSNRRGEAVVIPQAICIHEEDAGILFKHTDFRDGKCVVARNRKLVVSQVFTAANYEYCIYWNFFLDGTIQVELKLTGMLNTYCLHPTEEAAPWGTEVGERITAHNHQHIFCLRIDPQVDGVNNSVMQSDAMPSPHPPGSEENPYGNAFFCQKTVLKTTAEAACDYNHETSRTWDIVNPSKMHPTAKKPVAFKIVSRESPRLLAQPGSLVWNRAGFARHTFWVTPYQDDQLYPAGRYVPQTSGLENDLEGNFNIITWTKEAANIENTDVVCWLNFGLTHFPRAEDFPVMPTEPVSILLRPTNFFKQNPALDIRPLQAQGESQYAFENGKENGNGEVTEAMKKCCV